MGAAGIARCCSLLPKFGSSPEFGVFREIKAPEKLPNSGEISIWEQLWYCCIRDGCIRMAAAGMAAAGMAAAGMAAAVVADIATAGISAAGVPQQFLRRQFFRLKDALSKCGSLHGGDMRFVQFYKLYLFCVQSVFHASAPFSLFLFLFLAQSTDTFVQHMFK